MNLSNGDTSLTICICWKNREGERRETEGERKERKDKEIILLQKIKESRVVGMIRARGRLGRFRIASCCMIQPGQFETEWSKNWGLSSCQEDCQGSNGGHGL